MASLQRLMYRLFDIGSRMREGVGAFVTQSYTEVNSKRGRQFYISFYNPAVVADGGTADIVLQVGDEPLAIKDIISKFNSELISTRIYEQPTVTPDTGTELEVYNFRPSVGIPNLVTVLVNPTITDVGTPDGPEIYSLGNEAQGNRNVVSPVDVTGVERILEANTTYLYRITNRDQANDSELTGIATWYQGLLDY
jgi:hypothetical protein